MEEEERKGGHRRDILGSDGDATTVPIRHLPRERERERETDRSNERIHSVFSRARTLSFRS